MMSETKLAGDRQGRGVDVIRESFLNRSSSIVFGSEVKMPPAADLNELSVRYSAGVAMAGLWTEAEDEHGRPVCGGADI